jgi:Partial alpha/beta-hydrolase lipase region
MNSTCRFGKDEIIRNRGYPAEVHYVTTEDGYIIQIQRIPYGLQSGQASGKPVVYLQHGLLSASTDWVMGSVNKALGTDPIIECVVRHPLNLPLKLYFQNISLDLLE